MRSVSGRPKLDFSKAATHGSFGHAQERWENPELPTLDDMPDSGDLELLDRTRRTAQEIHDAEA